MQGKVIFMENTPNKIKSKDLIKSKKGDTSKFNFILVLVAAVVSFAMVIGCVLLVVSSCTDSKYVMQSKHYKMNKNEFSYLFYSGYYSELSSNYYTYYYNGLDTSDSLKNQDYTNSDGDTYTWYDVFMSNTVESVKQYMAFWEEAYDSKLTLDDNDIKEIDDTIDNIKQSAEEAGATVEAYVEYLYGDGNTLDDVRSAMEFYALAMKQYQVDYDAEEDKITDDDITEAYEADSTAYDYVDYRSYAITASYDEDATEDEIEAACTVAKENAESIANATTEEEFVANVQAYLTSNNVATDDEEALTEEEIASEAQNTLTERYQYESDTDFGTWAFTEGRAAGETTVIEGDDTYTAYYLVSAPSRLGYTTKNVCHILFSTSDTDKYPTEDDAKAKAEEVLALWQENPTFENLETLADEYNDDSSFEYDNIKLGDMAEEFEDWCYSDERNVGDCDIVQTSYGYHLIYFVGDGLPCWKAEVKDDILQENFETLIEELEEKYSASYEAAYLYKISGITAYCKTLETTIADDTAAAN